jgi:hypothetical protein
MVCGKQPVVSAPPKRQWFSYLGYGLAYVAVISPILLVAGLFPMTAQADDRRTSGKLCYVCTWTFGAFALVILMIAAGISWLVLTS